MAPDYEVAVAGGGIAGLTAALFAARQGRATILLDPLGASGAILNTERVEDFPGFPQGVPGFQLVPFISEQAMDAGGAVEPGEVTRLEQRDGDWIVLTDTREIVAGAVVVATGTRPRKLGVPGEDELEGKGVSHCAGCDGPLYRSQVVAMVGGGDSALLEALELAGHDVEVVLVHPDETLDGQETYSRRVRESGQIEVRPQTVPEAILGEGRVEGLRVRELPTGESSVLSVAAVFVHVGRAPNTAFLDEVLALDEFGHVATDTWMRTALPGLFAAGDVRADAAGQAVTAAGDGATAAIAAHRYLAQRGH